METNETLEMTIREFRVLESSNYTCRNEQDVHTKTYPATRVGLAMALDQSTWNAVNNRGCSGIGAGARVVALVEGPDGETAEIPPEHLPEGMTNQLPLGSAWHLYRAAAAYRRVRAWDGHNLVTLSPSHMNYLIEEIRAS